MKLAAAVEESRTGLPEPTNHTQVKQDESLGSLVL
jgi:hypothetical protein